MTFPLLLGLALAVAVAVALLPLFLFHGVWVATARASLARREALLQAQGEWTEGLSNPLWRFGRPTLRVTVSSKADGDTWNPKL